MKPSLKEKTPQPPQVLARVCLRLCDRWKKQLQFHLTNASFQIDGKLTWQATISKGATVSSITIC